MIPGHVATLRRGGLCLYQSNKLQRRVGSRILKLALQRPQAEPEHRRLAGVQLGCESGQAVLILGVEIDLDRFGYTFGPAR